MIFRCRTMIGCFFSLFSSIHMWTFDQAYGISKDRVSCSLNFSRSASTSGADATRLYHHVLCWWCHWCRTCYCGLSKNEDDCNSWDNSSLWHVVYLKICINPDAFVILTSVSFMPGINQSRSDWKLEPQFKSRVLWIVYELLIYSLLETVFLNDLSLERYK